MTERARAWSVLQGRAPDVLPWFGDLDYWVNSMKRKGTLPSEYDGDGYFRLHRDLGVGFYLQGYFPFETRREGVEIEDREEGGVFRRTIRTPDGTLRSEMRYLPDTYSWAHVRHLLNDAEDLPAYRYLMDHTTYGPRYEECRRKRALSGENGLSLCYLPRSPFMELVAEDAGLENLVYLLSDCPDEMEALLDTMERSFDRAAEIALASPAECLMIPENLSSEMVGEEYYLRYLRPYERKWTDRIRAAGKTSFIHMDGTLRGLVRLVAETGFDVLEAMTPLPSGDMAMEELAAVVPGPTVLWGGLPGIVFTPHMTDEEFDRHVLSVLAIMRREPRFVLGVGDQVPPDALWERVARVRRMVDEHGRMDGHGEAG
jgi:hypothetical protein